jgi:hypothetical protein
MVMQNNIKINKEVLSNTKALNQILELQKFKEALYYPIEKYKKIK